MKQRMYNMRRRVTFMIHDDLDRKVRQHQAKVMLSSNKTYSYSDAINDILKSM